MSRRDANLLIEDMLESIRKIFIYTENLDFNAFEDDDKTIDAVSCN